MSDADSMLVLSDWRHIIANVRRTSLNLNYELVEKAKTALGTKNTTDTVHRALENVVRQEALNRLADWKFDHLPEDWLDLEREPRNW
jgi:hypothetical protein